MKNKRGVLRFFWGCLLFFGFVGSANAMPTAESSYLWTSIDNGTFFVQNQYVANSAFGLYSWENNNSLLLFSANDTNLNRTMDVYSNVDLLNFEIDATKLVKIGRRYYPETDTLVLGSLPQFGFYFSDGATVYNTYALSGSASTGWDLSHGDMVVHIYGDATPSPVPLPASLPLLGSGLLGLLGAGCVKRKKHAVPLR